MVKTLMKSAPLLIGLALLSCGTGGASDVESDIEKYRKETTQNPKSIPAWRGLTEAYLRLARETDNPEAAAQAETVANSAVDLDATAPSTLYQMSRVKMEQGKFGQAVTLQDMVLVRRPLFWQAWGMMGDSYLELGHYRNADSCYSQMRMIDEGFRSLLHIARYAFVLTDFETAIELGRS